MKLICYFTRMRSTFLMLVFEHLFGDVSTNVLGHLQTQPRPKVQKNDKEYGGNFDFFRNLPLDAC